MASLLENLKFFTGIIRKNAQQDSGEEKSKNFPPFIPSTEEFLSQYPQEEFKRQKPDSPLVMTKELGTQGPQEQGEEFPLTPVSPEEFKANKREEAERAKREQVRQNRIQFYRNKFKTEKDFPGLLEDPEYEGKFKEYVNLPSETTAITTQDQYALKDLQKFFDIKQLAAEILYEKNENGQKIQKKEIPLDPKFKTSKLKSGDISIVMTTSEALNKFFADSDEPVITEVFLEGFINTTPNQEEETPEILDNYSFAEGAKIIIDAMPEYEKLADKEETEPKAKTPDAKRKILPEIIVDKSGPNTITGALIFPARSFFVDHPSMGKLHSHFDTKPIGIRVTRATEKYTPTETEDIRSAFNLFNDSVKLAQQSGFKPVRRQRDILDEFQEAGRKLQTRTRPTYKEEKIELGDIKVRPKDIKDKYLLKKDEKFSVYIRTGFSPKGEPTGDEYFVGTVYATTPEKALDLVVRVSGQTTSGYTQLLEKIYRIAQGLEKPPAQPKDLAKYYSDKEKEMRPGSKRREDRLMRRPGKGVREVTKEEIESWKK